MTTFARVVAVLVAATLAGLSFLVSFEALSDLAERWHALPGGMGWALPLMLDGLAVAAGVAALARRLDGHPARFPWGLVIGAALASLAGNVAHAPDGNTTAQLIASAPPIVAALALHLAMEEARRRHTTGTDTSTTPGTRAGTGTAPDHPTDPAPVPPAPVLVPVPQDAGTTADTGTGAGPLRADLTRAHPELAPPAPVPVPATTPPTASTEAVGPAHPTGTGPAAGPASGTARAAALRYLAEHPTATGPELAEAIGTGDSYARRLLREYRATPPASGTGTGTGPLRNWTAPALTGEGGAR